MSDDVLQLRLTGDATSLHSVLERVRKEADATAKAMLKSATDVEKEAAALKQKGAQVTAAVMTVTERYRRELATLDKLLKATAISQETHNRAVEKIRQKLPSVQKAQEQHNRALAQAKRVTEAMLTPGEEHSRLVLRLNNLLKAGHITQTTYNRAVEESRKNLPAVIEAERQAVEAQRALDKEMERGAKITRSLMTETERYKATRADLDRLLSVGAITTRTYDRALREAKQTLPLVAKAEKDAAEAQKLLDDQMARGKQLMDSVLPPTIRYQRLHGELGQLLRSGAIDLRSYLQLLAQESQKLPEVAKAQKLYDDAKKRGEQLTQQLLRPTEQYRQRLQELNTLLRDGHISTQTYTNGVRQLRAELLNISPALQRTSTVLRQIGGSLRMAGYISSAAITAPLTAFATAGVHSLFEFDKAMTYSLSIADNVTPKLRKEMEAVAITLSEKTAHSAIQLAEAYYELISAGLSAQASMKSLATVSKFAIAGNMNLEASVKSLAKATAAMGLAGKTADETARGMARTANVLVQAANMTTGSIQDMTQALINGAAPQARIVNMSLEDTVAVLMHYIQVGESAATSSEHFAIGLRLLGQAASQHKDFWKQQGLDLYTASGQMRKFTDVLRDMQKIYLNLSPQGRVPFLKALGFEALQQRALNPLLADPDAARQIDVWSEKLKKQGVLDEVAARQMQSLSNQFKVFLNMLQNVGMEVGRIILPYLNKFIYSAKQLIEYWKTLNDGGKKVAVVIGAIAAAIGPALIALGTMATIAATAASAIAAVVTAVLAIGAPVAAAIAAVSLLVGGILALVGGTMAYEYALSRWPKETEKTMRILERMWHAFEGFMASLFDKIFTVDMLTSFLKGVGLVAARFDPLTKLLAKAFSGQEVKKDVDKFAEESQKAIQDAFDRLGGRTNLGSSLARIIKEELGEGVGSSLEDLQKKIDDAVDVEGLKAKFAEVAKGLESPTGAFSKMGEEIQKVSERFRKQAVLEQAQADRGYEKINKMTNAERELMKIEADLYAERLELIEKYKKEGLDPESEAVKQAVANLEAQTKAQLEALRAQAQDLIGLEKQKRVWEELESLGKRFESPAEKFAREAKDLKKAFDGNKVSATQFAKEMHKLRDELVKSINIDFRVHGVEAVEAGTAQASAALEEFLEKQAAAKRPIDLETGKFKDAANPVAANAFPDTVQKAVGIQNPSPEMERLYKLSRTGGPVGAAARRQLTEMNASFKHIFRASETNRLQDLASKGGNIGFNARRNLARMGARTEQEVSDADRLRGLASRGGRLGYYAKKKLKQMGETAEKEAEARTEATTPRAAESRGESNGSETNDLSILKEPLERIARATEKTANSKSVKIEPANL